MLLENWILVQSQDPAIREIKYLINKNTLKGHKVYLQDLQIMKQYLRLCSHLVLHKGNLYSQGMPSKEDKNALQLVILQDYQKKALQGYHDDMRHMGLEQMLDFLWDQFYWPRMTKDVELHIAKCDQCIHLKSKPQKVVMENIQATHVLQLVPLDDLLISD